MDAVRRVTLLVSFVAIGESVIFESVEFGIVAPRATR
jgi:hypothetical protein